MYFTYFNHLSLFNELHVTQYTWKFYELVTKSGTKKKDLEQVKHRIITEPCKPAELISVRLQMTIDLLGLKLARIYRLYSNFSLETF